MFSCVFSVLYMVYFTPIALEFSINPPVCSPPPVSRPLYLVCLCLSYLVILRSVVFCELLFFVSAFSFASFVLPVVVLFACAFFSQAVSTSTNYPSVCIYCLRLPWSLVRASLLLSLVPPALVFPSLSVYSQCVSQ